MSDTNMAHALNVYNDLCQTLDNRGWVYQKDEEKLTLFFGVSGDDIPMQVLVSVDAERQLVRLHSPLPFKMDKEKLVEGAIITCVANYSMIDGSFDYDITDGSIIYRMTASIRESTINDALFQYLIDCAVAMVDHFNDQFLAVSKGNMSVSDFIEQH